MHLKATNLCCGVEKGWNGMASWFDELIKGDFVMFALKLGKRLLFGPDASSGEPQMCNSLLYQCPNCHSVGCMEKGCTRRLTRDSGICGCGASRHNFKLLPGGRCTGIRM